MGQRQAAVQGKGYDLLDKMLTPVSGYSVFQHVEILRCPNIAETPDDVRDNLEAMINGFSQNVRDVREIRFGCHAGRTGRKKTASTLWWRRFAENAFGCR